MPDDCGDGPPGLDPGLYLVSTPIGAARDITLRALDVLGLCDVIAAEDTRTTRRLLGIHAIALRGRPLISYHDHSPARVRDRLIERARGGQSIGYVSEAGTPLVADPGYRLVQDAIARAVPVFPVPGASAVLAGLIKSGLPSDRFLFAGFLPNGGAARKKALRELQTIPATLVFYENPQRVGKLLNDCVRTFGTERKAAVVRELTKRFEQAMHGSLHELATQLDGSQPLKGEYVVLVEGVGKTPRTCATPETNTSVDILLQQALVHASVRDAVTEVAGITGQTRRAVYQRALFLRSRHGQNHKPDAAT